MDRNLEEIVDLGAASVETRGDAGPDQDVIGKRLQAGISEDD